MGDSWFEAVAAVADGAPDAIAVRDGDTLLSYGDLLTRVGRLARWLEEQGVVPGDRIGVQLRKGIEEILATLACARLGVCFVHVHPQLTVPQVRHIALDSGMRMLIAEARRVDELAIDEELVAAKLALVAIGERRAPGGLAWPALDQGPGTERPLPDGDHLGALLYTSGSTGKPKGVMHSGRNLRQFAANVAAYLDLRPTDRVLGLLPLSFGYGLNQLLSTLHAGGTLVLQKAPFAAEVLKTLVGVEITGLAAVPSVWGQLLGALDQRPTPLPALRYVTNAGGHLSEKNARRLRAHLPHTDIVLMYGSSEALRSTYLPAALFDAKAGSIGLAIPNVEVFVVNAAGDLCQEGEVGELVHRGAHVSQGYWRNPEATALRFRSLPALRERYGDEAMYFSGDLVRRDADGILWFVSRSDWMVKSGGFRFSLSEVEELLLQTGLVKQAVAFTVEDEALGQAVQAVVVPSQPGATDPEALERQCWRTMAHYMIPKAFHVWPDGLPLLPNGKIDRPTLLRRVLGTP